MKIAYLILAHKGAEQLARLIDRLSKTGDSFVHVDKKVKIDEFQDCLKPIQNVYLEKKRKPVYWGGWSIVKAYMGLMQKALESETHYDRIVLMTGQDYPLMKDTEINKFFEEHTETEYIMAYNIMNSTVVTDKNKLLRRWYFDAPFKSVFLQRIYKGIMYRLITKNFARKKISLSLDGRPVDPYFGQMLSGFTRKGAELVLKTYLEDKKFNRVMKRAHAPDELYWQTIIFNSDLRKNTVQGGVEHEITEHFGWAPLHYHHYDVDTSIFTEDDFDEIKNSEYMFIRKVVPGKSDSLMDKIDMLRKEK